MSPLMIESIAVAQLTEHQETAARLRLRRQARAQSRGGRRAAGPTASAGHSILSLLHLRAHPA